MTAGEGAVDWDGGACNEYHGALTRVSQSVPNVVAPFNDTEGATMQFRKTAIASLIAFPLALNGAAATDGGLERVVAIAPPLAFFDWDFLAAVQSPVSVVVGDRDEWCPHARLSALMGRYPVQTLEGADHFFGGHEDDVAEAVVRACLTG